MKPKSSTSLCVQCGQTISDAINDGLCASCMMLDALSSDMMDGSSEWPEAPLEEQTDRELFGHFEILDQIAHGGMGIVYKARHTKLDRIVALKTLLLGGRASSEMIQRFKREAEAAAKLKHPNIVAVHEVGEFEGQHYIAMDFVNGQNLASSVTEQSLPEKKAAHFVRDIALAVQHAHDHQILHRDLKPSNILIDLNQEVYVTDFGLAKRLDEASSITLTGQVLGSPNYLPPEQAAGNHQHVNRSSDIYSMGAILYQCLTGRAPFMAESVQETLIQIRDNAPPSPRVLNPDLSADLETICLKCLQKQPEKRYAESKELAEDLDRFLTGIPILARPVSQTEKAWRWCHRHPTVAILSAALILSVIVGFSATVWQLNRVQQQSKVNQQQVAQLSVMNGVTHMEKGDYFHSLLWFTDALVKNPEDPHRKDIHRKRIASVLGQCPSLASIVSHDGNTIAYAAFSPLDDRLATVGSDLRIRVKDIQSGETIWMSEPFEDPPYDVQFSPDAKHITVGFLDLKGTCQVFQASDGSSVSPRLPHLTNKQSFLWNRPIFSPNGQKLAIQSNPGEIRIWNLREQTYVGESIKAGSNLRSLQFAHDSMTLLTICSKPDQYGWWDVRTGNRLPLPFTPTLLDKGITLHDDRSLAVSQRTLIDPEVPNKTFASFEFSANAKVQLFHPDGLRLVSGHIDRSVHFFELSDGIEYKDPISLKYKPDYLEISPDGTLLLVDTEDDRVQIFDMDSGKPFTPILLHDDTKVRAHFSGSGRYLCTFHPSHLLYIWDLGIEPSVPAYAKPLLLWNDNTDERNGHIIAEGSVGFLRVFDGKTGASSALRTTAHMNDIYQSWLDENGEFIILETTGLMLQIYDKLTATPVTPRFESRYTADPNLYRKIQWQEISGREASVRKSVQVMAGMRLDDHDSLLYLTADEIQEGWKTMIKTDAIYEDMDMAGWHQSLARKLANQRNYEAAMYHLQKFMGLDPSNPENEVLLQYLQSCKSYIEEKKRGYARSRGVFPPRDPGLPETMLDLSPHLKHATPLPLNRTPFIPTHQVIQSQNISFDFRGNTFMAGQIARGKDNHHPVIPVMTIPVGMQADRIHFLHNARDTYAVPDHTTVAHFKIEYINGQTVEQEIQTDRQIENFWKGDRDEPSECHIAWLGSDRHSNTNQRSLVVYHYIWNNPTPQEEVKSIHIQFEEGPCSYALYAITVEPPPPTGGSHKQKSERSAN